jgi:large subunit ribosomal protein L35
MPKTKTRKSIVNRFRVTKNGKVLRRHAFTRHLKASKSKKQIRNLNRPETMGGAYAKKIRRALGK